MNRIRMAVVGVGHLGKEHARILSAFPDVELVGVADVSPNQARAVADRCRTRAFLDHEDLFDLVDAVSIAAPTLYHHQISRAFLQRGIPVLVEKPITTTLAQAEELVEIANAQGVPFQVGHIERFNPAFEDLAGRPLTPKLIESERHGPFTGRSTDIGVVLDLMIHDLDLILELVRSEVREVRATGVPVLTPHVDIANARVEFANGAVALVTASRISRERTRKLRIFQPTGYFSLDLAQGSGQFYRLKPGWQALGARRIEDIVEAVRLDAPEAEPLKLELESFLRAVRGESEVVVSGAAGAHALALAWRVADAIQASPVAAIKP
jgi:predicted dehydrogenase